MDFANERNISLDQAGTDYVSKCIRMIAVGMMVLGVLFAVLDRYELLPQLPEPPQLSHAAANQAAL
jgi:hypothetical protein